MPNTFDNVGAGGLEASASSNVKLISSSAGFNCFAGGNKFKSHGAWILADARRGLIQDQGRSQAYVAAITVCRQNLKDRIKPVFVKVFPPETPKTTIKIFAEGGGYVNGGVVVQQIFNVIGSSGVKASGNSIIIGGITDFIEGSGLEINGDAIVQQVADFIGSDGIEASGDSYVSSDFSSIFDGTFYLENSSPSGIPVGNNPRSILAWVRANKLSTDPKALFGYGGYDGGDDGSGINELVYNTSGSFDVGVDYGSLFNSANITENAWVLVGISYDGTNMRFHMWDEGAHIWNLNPGTLFTTSAKIRVAFGLNGIVNVDAYSDIENVFIGDILGLGIWNVALSDDDVASYYYTGRTTYSGLPSRIRSHNVTTLSNAQARSLVITNIQAREIISGDLQVTGSNPIDALAHWAITETSGTTIHDSSGNEFDGTLSGTVDFTTDTVISTPVEALVFSSSYPYASGGTLTIPHDARFNTYPITVSAWVKTEQGDSGGVGIVNKYISSSYNGYLVYLYGGHIYAWYMRDSSNLVWTGSGGLDGGAINDGNWHLITFTVDADGGKLYVDASLVASHTWFGTPGPITSAQDVIIGRYDNYFNGIISDVRIYDSALSSDNVSRLYSGEDPIGLSYLGTSEGSNLEFVTVSLNNLESSSGVLQASKPVVSNITTSSGSTLQFGSLVETNSVVSFWNLTEDSGTRYDSVGGNHLTQVNIE